MDHNSSEKLHVLDQIENQIYQMMQFGTAALNEFSKDKPSIKNVESQVSQFVKFLEMVDNNVSKQLQYLSQVSTLQPHEGSTYSTMKINQLAMLRLEHVRSCLTELEHLKKQHQIQLQKYQSSKTAKIEPNQDDPMDNKVSSHHQQQHS
ncbi:mediator complex subunit 11 [Dermatophagoides farinae]|uniref:Mediator of RNA polymerase II transcription subunit 11 n=1 Tax=Dermatophagoides farinae TaxID=6954 RepID=A0A922L9F8_DERFA|nr:mediator of RNA polymerase II transcription subunit 11-like [Dermatophagoides farinae]KAH7636231.1 med11-like protein [Dermatophagoides farinae]KAH9528281.1 Mediator of RNA polymerase II transcription subunit 11 [Dermatophagoides farinae]